MNTVAIIQARTGSSRLPNKVMRDLAGEPMLVRVVNRVKRAHLLDSVIVATTTNPKDRVIFDLCNARGFLCTKGSEDDVLDRYEQTANAYDADNIVRITSDCPLIEPTVIDRVVAEFYASHVDYASNFIKQTYPVGLSCEIVTRAALSKAWKSDNQWREHVTPYIYKHPELFRLKSVENDVDYSWMRWTVDTSEDIQFARKVYGYFGHDRFSWREVLELLAEHPDWQEINKDVVQKTV